MYLYSTTTECQHTEHYSPTKHLAVTATVLYKGRVYTTETQIVCRSVSYDRSIPKPNIFTRDQTQHSFQVCNLCSLNLLTIMNSFLCTVLVLCLVSDLKKLPSLGDESRTLNLVLTVLKSLSGVKKYATISQPNWCILS
jgi:hypothetical protein